MWSARERWREPRRSARALRGRGAHGARRGSARARGGVREPSARHRAVARGRGGRGGAGVRSEVDVRLEEAIGELSAVELVEAALGRLEATEPDVHAWASV